MFNSHYDSLRKNQSVKVVFSYFLWSTFVHGKTIVYSIGLRSIKIVFIKDFVRHPTKAFSLWILDPRWSSDSLRPAFTLRETASSVLFRSKAIKIFLKSLFSAIFHPESTGKCTGWGISTHWVWWWHFLRFWSRLECYFNISEICNTIARHMAENIDE